MGTEVIVFLLGKNCCVWKIFEIEKHLEVAQGQ